MTQATGRGHRQVCFTDKFGFRRKKKNGEYAAPRSIKRVHGFQTGDIARVLVPEGKNNAGTYITRIAIRKAGSFSIKPNGYSKPFKTTYKNCQIVHRSDGYDYSLGEAFISA